MKKTSKDITPFIAEAEVLRNGITDPCAFIRFVIDAMLRHNNDLLENMSAGNVEPDPFDIMHALIDEIAIPVLKNDPPNLEVIFNCWNGKGLRECINSIIKQLGTDNERDGIATSEFENVILFTHLLLKVADGFDEYTRITGNIDNPLTN